MNLKKSSTILKRLLSVSQSSDVKNNDSLLCRLYSAIKFEDFTTEHFDDLSELVQLVAHRNTNLSVLITRDWEKIIIKMFECAKYEDDFCDIRQLFVKYEFNYREFLHDNWNTIQSTVDAFWAKAFFKIGYADFDRYNAEYINDQLGLENLDSSPFFADHCYYISQSREYLNPGGQNRSHFA
jgi:hypothetical protein